MGSVVPAHRSVARWPADVVAGARSGERGTGGATLLRPLDRPGERRDAGHGSARGHVC